MTVQSVQVTLIGHLGREVTVEETKGGRLVGRFDLAVNPTYLASDGTWRPDGTVQWWHCVLWGPKARLIVGTLTPTDRLIVTGRIKGRPATSPGGASYTRLEVVVEDIGVSLLAPSRPPDPTTPACDQDQATGPFDPDIPASSHADGRGEGVEVVELLTPWDWDGAGPGAGDGPDGSW